LLNDIIRRGRCRTPGLSIGQEIDGGARAWAWEPALKPNNSGAALRQTTRWV
jgi:hypothetical protein